jgi:hypothetical protein
LYFEGGDPSDLSGGCTLDYMPVACSYLRDRVDSGTVATEYPLIRSSRTGRPDNRQMQFFGLGIVAMYVPDGARGNDSQLELYGFAFVRPPRAGQGHDKYRVLPERRLTQDETDKIKATLQKILTDNCKAFIKELFAAVGSDGSQDIVNTFNDIAGPANKEGGFFFQYYELGKTADGVPIFPGATVRGNLITHNARVELNPSSQRLDLGNNLLYAAEAVLHEIIHHNTGLGDTQIAMRLAKEKGEEFTSGGAIKDSGTWDQKLKDACLGKGY